MLQNIEIGSDQNMDEFLAKSRSILQSDEDSWYERKFNWFCNNFSGPELVDYIEDLVENCLDLAMKHSMDDYVRAQLRFQQQGVFHKECTHRELTKPTTRWAGLSDRTTFKFKCTSCHEWLVNQRDACKCPGVPYGEHDSAENPECRKTCVQRFGDIEN